MAVEHLPNRNQESGYQQRTHKFLAGLYPLPSKSLNREFVMQRQRMVQTGCANGNRRKLP
jgi:hypothetical protein